MDNTVKVTIEGTGQELVFEFDQTPTEAMIVDAMRHIDGRPKR